MISLCLLSITLPGENSTYSGVGRVQQCSLELLFSLTFDHTHRQWIKIRSDSIHLEKLSFERYNGKY